MAIWDVSTRSILAIAKFPAPVSTAAWSRQGLHVASVLVDGRITFSGIDKPSGEAICYPFRPAQDITSITFAHKTAIQDGSTKTRAPH